VIFLNKLHNRLVENIKSMKNGVVLLSRLIVFFHRETKIEYFKISLNMFFGKFINMLVMFMPLKLMFVLTGDKNIEAFATLEAYIGRSNYIGMVLFFLTFFYFANVMLNVYKAKLINRQEARVDLENYSFSSREIKASTVKRTVVPFCQMLSDTLLVSFVNVLLLFMNPILGLCFTLVLVLFYLIHEQWVFSSHETNLLRKLAIDKSNLVQILSMVMFLVAFFVLVFVVISYGINAILAILMLLLIRLANSAYKSHMSAQIKLRRFYS